MNDSNCVVCLVGNGDLTHDCNDHQIVGFHEVDETPTSEPCLGVDNCPDCQTILAIREEAGYETDSL